MMITRLLFLITVLAGSHVSLRAAEASFLPWDEAVAGRKLAIEEAGEARREIQYMHPNSRGEVFKLKSGTDLRLLALDRAENDGTLPSLPLRIPAGASKVIFLLVPDEKHPAGLRVVTLDDSQENFGWGTIRALNATGRPLFLTWEKHYVELPAKDLPVEIRPGGKTRNMQVMLFLEKSAAKPIYSAVWEHDENLRTLLIITPGMDLSRAVADFRFVTEDRRAIPVKPAE